MTLKNNKNHPKCPNESRCAFATATNFLLFELTGRKEDGMRKILLCLLLPLTLLLAVNMDKSISFGIGVNGNPFTSTDAYITMKYGLTSVYTIEPTIGYKIVKYENTGAWEKDINFGLLFNRILIGKEKANLGFTFGISYISSSALMYDSTGTALKTEDTYIGLPFGLFLEHFISTSYSVTLKSIGGIRFPLVGSSILDFNNSSLSLELNWYL